MNAQQLLEWIEVLKKCGYGHWEAEAFVAHHLSGAVPVERPQLGVSNDEFPFDIGGSD